MSADQEPTQGKGFIYVLSNESMPGLLKVGLTENSVRQRIRELSGSTGVPTEFKLEKAFEIDAHLLFRVEQTIHRNLKDAGFHHQKEFFKVSLTQCTTFTEDVILRITGVTAPELVGEASRRSKTKKAKEQWETSERTRRENLLAETNRQISKRREDWLASQRTPSHQKIEEPWYEPIFSFLSIAIGVAGVLFMLYAFGAILSEFLGVALTVVLIVGAGFWIYLKEQNTHDSHERLLNVRAAEFYPYKALEDIPRRTYEAQPLEEEKQRPANDKVDLETRKENFTRGAHNRFEENDEPRRRERDQRQRDGTRQPASVEESEGERLRRYAREERLRQEEKVRREEALVKASAEEELKSKSGIRAYREGKPSEPHSQSVEKRGKSWRLYRSKNQLFHIESSTCFAEGAFWREQSSSISGYRVNHRKYPFAWDEDIEEVP
jgi:hypothetical protein